MTMLFIDGFDHYSNMLDKWDSFDSVSNGTTYVAGRFGGQAARYQFQNGSGNVKNLKATETELYVGFAYNPPSLDDEVLFRFRNPGGSDIAKLEITSSGNVLLRRFGTVLDTSVTTPITAGTWHYIELHYKPDATSGIFECRVNEVVEATFSGQTTEAGNDIGAVVMWGTGTNAPRYLIDDLYVLNADGAVNNTYKGDTRVITLLPDAEGNHTEFTPSAGTDNSAMVDDPVPGPDDDATYVESGTINARDTYSMASAPTVGANIHTVQLNAFVRKTDAGAVSAALMTRDNSVDTVSPTETISDTYHFMTHIEEDEPSTSTTWTETLVDAAEYGTKVIAV